MKVGQIIKYIITTILVLIIVAGLSVFLRVAWAFRYSQIMRNDPAPTVSSMPVYSFTEQDVWDRVQNWRTSVGLPQYKMDADACTLASTRLPEVKQNWSHGGMQSRMDNKAWAEFGKLAAYTKLGENLAKDFTTAPEVLNGWVTSPSHLKALMEDFTHGCIKCEDGICVHIFVKY